MVVGGGRVHILRRGPSERSCEARAASSGDGFELVITIDGASHIEAFSTLDRALARARALLSNWRAHGWKEKD
ncbi:MAG TPA: hypothetical protein VFZ98_00995 [Vicinamibacterales bacterium]